MKDCSSEFATTERNVEGLRGSLSENFLRRKYKNVCSYSGHRGLAVLTKRAAVLPRRRHSAGVNWPPRLQRCAWTRAVLRRVLNARDDSVSNCSPSPPPPTVINERAQPPLKKKKANCRKKRKRNLRKSNLRDYARERRAYDGEGCRLFIF